MANIRKIQNRGGQKLVSLPRDARDALGIEAGDYVDVTVEDGRIVVSAVEIQHKTNPGVSG